MRRLIPDYIKELPSRFWWQLAVTILMIVTSFAALALCCVVAVFASGMKSNVFGPTSGNDLPCVRATLDACIGTDRCSTSCCPPNYQCTIEPVAGLTCQILTSEAGGYCGDFDFCRDFADITQGCRTQACMDSERVLSLSKWAVACAVIALLLDLGDVPFYFVGIDMTAAKAGVNVMAAIFKLICLSILVASKAEAFIASLSENHCYNQTGVETADASSQNVLAAEVVAGLSAFLSVALAPFSAYWGGRLSGIPYASY